jgi:hypothetical protein
MPAPADYETKFADFLRMCDDAKAGKFQVIAVANPKVLGDNYDELVESLNRIADAGGQLAIAKRCEH